MTIERDNPKQFFYNLFDTLIEQQRLIMGVSKLDNLLERLEKNGSITSEEHRILLDLAKQLQPEGSWMSLRVMNSQL